MSGAADRFQRRIPVVLFVIAQTVGAGGG